VRTGPRATVLRGEPGFVAGAEALVLGVLVFVLGSLVVMNGWAVLDARFAAAAAAREAVRAIVEAPAATSREELSTRARTSAEDAFAAHGYDPARVELTPEVPLGQRRCEPVRVRAEVVVTMTILPRFTTWSQVAVGSTHEEVIDPFRSGLDGEARCGF
jgi:hypothetical protein